MPRSAPHLQRFVGFPADSGLKMTRKRHRLERHGLATGCALLNTGRAPDRQAGPSGALATARWEDTADQSWSRPIHARPRGSAMGASR